MLVFAWLFAEQGHRQDLFQLPRHRRGEHDRRRSLHYRGQPLQLPGPGAGLRGVPARQLVSVEEITPRYSRPGYDPSATQRHSR